MKLRVPHLVAKANADGTLRHYWQPAARLHLAGWRTRPLGPDQAAAIAEAERLNRQVEAWRRGTPAPADAPVARTPGRARERAAPGTVADLIARYRASEYFLDLAPRTRADYELHLDRIEGWAGPERAALIRPAHAREWYNALRKKAPMVAAYTMRVARLLWGRAELLGLAGTPNPFQRLRLQSSARAGNPWPAAAVEAFAAEADAMGQSGVADAVLLNYWLGQRPADLLRLPRTIYTEPTITVRQRKTGAWVVIDVSACPPVQARLAAMAARAADRAVQAVTAVVNPATGAPYNESTFRHDFAAVRAALAAAHPDWLVDYVPRSAAAGGAQAGTALRLPTTRLLFKDLRATALLAMASAGATTEQMIAVSGHSRAAVSEVLEHYVPRTATLARAALQARLGTPGEREKLDAK